MRIKIVVLAAVLLSGLKSNALVNTDTVSLTARSKFTKSVKVGPVYYLLPPEVKVDTVLIKRLAIDELFKNRLNESVMLRYYENVRRLNALLGSIDVYFVPSDGQVASLEPMLNSARYAGDRKTQSLILNSFAVYYAKKGIIGQSELYLKESLVLREQLSDKPGTRKIIAGLAELAELSGKYEDAINYTHTLINQIIPMGKSLDLAQYYVRVSNLKCLQKDYAEAENLILKKALPMFRGNKPGRMSCFRQLASIYELQKRYSEAKWYSLQAKTIAEGLNDNEAIVACLVQLAAIKNILGEREMAINDFKQAERMAFQNNFLARLIEIKGGIGEIYRIMGDYTAAGSAIDEYSRLKSTFLRSGLSSY